MPGRYSERIETTAGVLTQRLSTWLQIDKHWPTVTRTTRSRREAPWVANANPRSCWTTAGSSPSSIVSSVLQSVRGRWLTSKTTGRPRPHSRRAIRSGSASASATDQTGGHQRPVSIDRLPRERGGTPDVSLSRVLLYRCACCRIGCANADHARRRAHSLLAGASSS